jgi:hypothetical protein
MPEAKEVLKMEDGEGIESIDGEMDEEDSV